MTAIVLYCFFIRSYKPDFSRSGTFQLVLNKNLNLLSFNIIKCCLLFGLVLDAFWPETSRYIIVFTSSILWVSLR